MLNNTEVSMNDPGKLRSNGSKEELTTNGYGPEFKAKVIRHAIEDGHCQALIESACHRVTLRNMTMNPWML